MTHITKHRNRFVFNDQITAIKRCGLAIPLPALLSKQEGRFLRLVFLMAAACFLFAAHDANAQTVLPFPAASPYNAPGSGNTVLLYGPSLASSSNSEEQQAAIADGYDVVVATAAQWSSMTTSSAFATYRALIFGDKSCSTVPALLASAVANNTTWAAAVTGNIIVIGTDPTVHTSNGSRILMRRGIGFAVGTTPQTGLYVALSCYYVSLTTPASIPLLSPFGTFTVHGNVAYNNAHIVATGPSLTGPSCPGLPVPLLTDTVLSNWGSSVHEGFDAWPPSFDVFAIAQFLTTVYTATDGTQGLPYILTRGTQPIRSIALGPATATNPLGTPHTVTATISPIPTVGTPVTFHITTGPNAPLTLGPFPTNAAGVASATYTGSGGVGLDVITASYPHAGVIETSNTARKTWVEATACAIVRPVVRCDLNHPGAFLATLTVTNHTGGPITSVLLTPPVGSTYTLGQQVFTIPSLANGASTPISFSITGAASGTRLCFIATLMDLQQSAVGAPPCARCCCSVNVCLDIPDCDCAVITSQTLTPVAGTPGSFTYTFTVTNNSAYTIQHVYIHTFLGATATPSHLAVSIAPGGSYSGTVTLNGLPSPNFCLFLTFHDVEMRNCCTVQRCFGNIQ
ncbi:MAG TPA: hypothetical protein VN687_08050 [Blastocatellia bacterium]|nr:hypothetical protein [Blastocatellia bacterium]